MKISKFEIIDKSLFWRKEKTLIIGDLHLGYEQLLQEHGYYIPKSQNKETLNDLKEILKQTGKCNEIILLGDVKHYFSGILKAEWNDFFELIHLLKENLNPKGKIIITKGNHDSILEHLVYQIEEKNPQSSTSEIQLHDYYIKKSILFIHGDYKTLKKISKIRSKSSFSMMIMGHFHPAIMLKDKLKIKQERYKCFLYGKSSPLKLETIILPSFFPLIEGTDILSKDSLLEGWFDIKNFEVFALDDKGHAYDFGKVGKIR
jgi:hypothetical protein